MKYTIFSFAIIFTFFVGASYAFAQIAPGCSASSFTSCGNGAVACGNARRGSQTSPGCYYYSCSPLTIQGRTLSAVGPGPEPSCSASYNGASCTQTSGFGLIVRCDNGLSDDGVQPTNTFNGYTLNILPQITSITRGDTAIYTISIDPSPGMENQTVQLTFANTDCPSNSICSFVGGYSSGGIQYRSVSFASVPAPATVTFTIQTSSTTFAPNTYSFRVDSNVLLATGPSATALLSVSNAQINEATCSSFSAPNTVQVGQTFTGTFTMLNSGTKNWTTASWPNGYYLFSANSNWTNNTLSLPSNPITPGSSATMSGTFTAPSTPGTYLYSYRLAEMGAGYFGDSCAKNITVTSTPPPPSGNPPTLTVDAPTSGATVSGNVSLSGWALDNTSASETAISAVRVYLDGTLLGNATITNRQDVCNIWNRPGCPNVGWTYSWNSALTSNGSHTIRVDAVDSDSTPQTSSVSRSVTVSNIVTPAPTITLSATPSSVTSGSSATISWTVANATSCVNAGTDQIPNANWTSGTTGSVSSGALTSNKSYRLSCTGAGGTTLSNIQTVTVTVVAGTPPDITAFTASPNAGVTTSALQYWISNAPTSCVASSNPVNSGWNRTFTPVQNSPTVWYDITWVSNINQTTTFTLTCSNAFGSDTASAVVTNGVTQPDLTASSPTPISATAGTPVTFSSTISNIGSASTGASFSNFFQIATGANGTGTVTDLTSSSMGTLAVSGTGTATSPSYTFSSAGTYYVRACADKTNSSSAGSITESNEGNNCSSSWSTVTVATASGPVPIITTLLASPPATGPDASLQYWISNAPTSCVASSNPVNSGWNRTFTPVQHSPTVWYDITWVSNINQTTTFTLTCSNAFGAGSPQSVVVSAPIPTTTYYNINIIKSGRGTVTVNDPNATECPPGPSCAQLEGEGIVLLECGPTCTGQIIEGSRINVRAASSPNRIFVGWSGVTCAEGNQRNQICSFRMNSDKTIYANFVVDPNYKEF